MNIEAKKISIIERVMKIQEASDIKEVEATITRIEMNNRADNSIEDIKQGRTRPFEEFGLEVKKWIENQKNTK